MNKLCDEITTLEKRKDPTIQGDSAGLVDPGRKQMISAKSYKQVTGSSSVHMVRLKNMSELLDEINSNNSVSQKAI